MAKKKSILSNLPIYLTLGTMAVGAITGWARLNSAAEMSKDEISTIKSDVKEVKKDSETLAREVEVSKNEQKNLSTQVDKVSEKIDKVVDLLVEINKKK